LIIVGRLKWAEVANELHKMCLNEERKEIIEKIERGAQNG
jgi:hypothetical protein